ncbi:MAG: B12-binding domain-containing radical SAM protein [Chloroflexota bacterium]|nr:B12-binding domain-containing radical SAM protein [Chloroflexota bacterium]
MDIDKIVLIYPERDGRIWGKAQGSPYTLMRLASLVPDDIPVEIWDEDLGVLPLHRLGPHDLVGITSKTLSIDRAKEIGAAANQRGSTVVVGGTHATLIPEEVQRWADITVVGEAYSTWPQIIRDIATESAQKLYVDESWASLDGVAPLTDRVIKMVDEHRNYWTPYMEITRGCPRDCTFCTAIRVSGRVMRHRPVEEVVEEIARRRLKRFFLTDDNFGLNFRTNPEYIVQVFEALAKLKLNGWTAQAEMMVGNFPDLLALARRAHLDKFFIGFESVNTSNRRDLGGKSKGNIEEYRRIIRTIHEHGIGVVGLFVLGLDGDTTDVFESTWNFVRESELDSVSFTIMTPYPGTELRREYAEQNRLLPNVPWSLYDTAHVVFQPAQMTVEQLRRGYDWICHKAYDPASIAVRGLRTLQRHPIGKYQRRLFSSFSTDFGYRKTVSYRDRERDFRWRTPPRLTGMSQSRAE